MIFGSLFDTVELNTTFYRLPSPEAVESWAAQAPPGFVYALKLGQFGSHRMKLRDAASWLPNHLDRARRLGPSLGPTLVQLPPRWKRNTERLDEFLAEANRLASDLRWAARRLSRTGKGDRSHPMVQDTDPSRSSSGNPDRPPKRRGLKPGRRTTTFWSFCARPLGRGVDATVPRHDLSC